MTVDTTFQSFIRFYMERMLECAAVPNDPWGFILDSRFYLSFMPNHRFDASFSCLLRVTRMSDQKPITGIVLCCTDLDDDAGMEKLKLQLRTLCIDLLFDQF